MIRAGALALAGALFVTACSGGSGSTPGVVHPAVGQGAPVLVATTFVFAALPAATSASARNPKYVTANVASVAIALNTVNGGAPPASVTASVRTNITLAGCPCTVAGPAVPPGSDTFSLTAYDAPNGGGHAVSTATPTLTIVAGQANSNTITLNGVPASFTIAPPSGTAGTAFGATAFSVTVKDADGNTIMGTYDNPVTLADSDASGATTLATSGSDSPPAGQLLSSGDIAKLSYTGLAMAPKTISAVATGATTGNGSFAPALQPILTTAPLNLATPEIALTQSTSSGAFTASEVGWTNAPYNKSVTATQGVGCGTIGTTAPASGTVFTTTVVGSPAAGNCTLTLSDFTGGSTVAVTLAYVTGSQLFTYTSPGGQQNFTVPFGVSEVTVAAAGAQGGTANNGSTAAGNGGSVTATIPVVAGASLAVFVGGAGGAGNGIIGSGAGGFNGGAAGGGVFFTGGGGGASSVSISGTSVVVAGGGGGGGLSGSTGSTGGDGGGPVAAPGAAGNFSGGFGGGGGTGSTGGTGGAGTGTGGAGSAGGAGSGGAGRGGCTEPGGGGGGGYYGGGGGGCSSIGYGGGGGGGSSFIEATAIGTPTNTQGGHAGNGTITISW